MTGFILAPSRAARRRDLHVALCAALAGLTLIVGGFAAGALSTPAPPLRCALLAQR